MRYKAIANWQIERYPWRVQIDPRQKTHTQARPE